MLDTKIQIADESLVSTIEAEPTAAVEARVMAAFGIASAAISEEVALDADELETLQDLVVRYDQVVHDLDILNKQIESLLAAEGIKGCES